MLHLTHFPDFSLLHLLYYTKLAELRGNTNKELALGTDRFMEHI